jgi:glycosyltransferase involved in cell wall biosynthesis
MDKRMEVHPRRISVTKSSRLLDPIRYPGAARSEINAIEYYLSGGSAMDRPAAPSLDSFEKAEQNSDQSPRVSVLLITYNHEPYLSEALDSILKQNASFAWELVISEDCSTDRTLEIVHKYSAKHPTAKIILSDHNLNTNEVSSRAIKICSGEYIAYIDGDDVWLSDQKLQQQVDYLDRNPFCTLCFHDVCVIDKGGKVLGETWNGQTAPALIGIDELIGHNSIASCSAMFRRSAIGELPKSFDNVPFGDWALWVLATRNGMCGYLPEVLAARRKHPAGCYTSMNSRQKIEENLRCLDWFEVNLDSKFMTSVRRAQNAWRKQLAEEQESNRK